MAQYAFLTHGKHASASSVGLVSKKNKSGREQKQGINYPVIFTLEPFLKLMNYLCFNRLSNKNFYSFCSYESEAMSLSLALGQQAASLLRYGWVTTLEPEMS